MNVSQWFDISMMKFTPQFININIYFCLDALAEHDAIIILHVLVVVIIQFVVLANRDDWRVIFT